MKPKIANVKLGRYKAWGVVFEDGEIGIDPRLPTKERLRTVIHEAVHVADMAMEEKDVERMANKIADIVWRDNWRRIEK